MGKRVGCPILEENANFCVRQIHPKALSRAQRGPPGRPVGRTKSARWADSFFFKCPIRLGPTKCRRTQTPKKIIAPQIKNNTTRSNFPVLAVSTVIVARP
jgi:hypothetical protein